MTADGRITISFFRVTTAWVLSLASPTSAWTWTDASAHWFVKVDAQNMMAIQNGTFSLLRDRFILFDYPRSIQEDCKLCTRRPGELFAKTASQNTMPLLYADSCIYGMAR